MTLSDLELSGDQLPLLRIGAWNGLRHPQRGRHRTLHSGARCPSSSRGDERNIKKCRLHGIETPKVCAFLVFWFVCYLDILLWSLVFWVLINHCVNGWWVFTTFSYWKVWTSQIIDWSPINERSCVGKSWLNDLVDQWTNAINVDQEWLLILISFLFFLKPLMLNNYKL